MAINNLLLLSQLAGYVIALILSLFITIPMSLHQDEFKYVLFIIVFFLFLFQFFEMKLTSMINESSCFFPYNIFRRTHTIVLYMKNSKKAVLELTSLIFFAGDIAYFSQPENGKNQTGSWSSTGLPKLFATTRFLWV